MARQVIVLSGKGRIEKVKAICSQTWLKPSGVVGLAVDFLTSDVLEAKFGKEIACRIVVQEAGASVEVIGAGNRKAVAKAKGTRKAAVRRKAGFQALGGSESNEKGRSGL